MAKKRLKAKSTNIKAMEKDMENIMTSLDESWQKFCRKHHVAPKDAEEMFDDIMTAGIVMEMFRKKAVGGKIKGKA